MIKASLIAMVLSASAAVSFGQASAPAESASAPVKHKFLKKLKNHKPGSPAADPERMPDKKGGA